MTDEEHGLHKEPRPSEHRKLSTVERGGSGRDSGPRPTSSSRRRRDARSAASGSPSVVSRGRRHRRGSGT